MFQKLFNYLLKFSTKNSLLIILLTIVLSSGFAFFIVTRLDVRADVQSLVPEDDHVLELIEKYDMPRSDYLVLAVQADDPFSEDGLRAFSRSIEDILQIEGIYKVMSPFNQMAMEKQGSFFRIAPLLHEGTVPDTEQDLEAYRLRLLGNPFTRNLIISEDGTMLLALFQFHQVEDYEVFMDAVDRASEPLYSYYDVYITGFPMFERDAKIYMLRDMYILMAVGLLFILGMYFFSFRSLRAILLPSSVVVMGTIWTLGFMALLKFPVTVVSVVTPPLVLTLGSSYSIHILNEYYRGQVDTSSRTDWLQHAVSHVNKTIFMAAGTTIAGFFSLLSSKLIQTREFALAASFGIFACALLSLFFLPAVLSRLKQPTAKQTVNVQKGLVTKLIIRLGHFIFHYRIPILIFLILVPIVFVFTFRFLPHQNDYKNYFPNKSRALQDNHHISRTMGGVQQLNVTFSAPDNQEGYFLDPEILQQIDAFEQTLRDNENITYVLSFNSFVRELNFLKTGKREVTENKSPILLLSRIMKRLSADDAESTLLSQIADDSFSRLNVTFYYYDRSTGLPLEEEGLRTMRDGIEENLRKMIPQEIDAEVWGSRLLYLTLYKTMNNDLLRSTLIALVIIFLITALSFRSFKYGFLAIIPMIIGIAMNFVFMVIVRLPLDMTTVMVSCVAIGIGVDDSIHFLLQYRRQQVLYPRHPRHALIRTMEIAGRPIILTSLSIIGGVLVLALASFKPIAFFGILVSTALLFTTAGCLIFLPALMSVSRQRKPASTLR